MCAVDPDQARRQMTATADLVQSISDRVHAAADQVGASEPAFTDLAAATDKLAALALRAVQAIDASLALASHRGVSAMLASSQHELAISWTVTLDKALDASLAIYARACTELADRVSVAEEHLADAPPSAGHHLSAVLLGRDARALTRARLRIG